MKIDNYTIRILYIIRNIIPNKISNHPIPKF